MFRNWIELFNVHLLFSFVIYSYLTKWKIQYQLAKPTCKRFSNFGNVLKAPLCTWLFSTLVGMELVVLNLFTGSDEFRREKYLNSIVFTGLNITCLCWLPLIPNFTWSVHLTCSWLSASRNSCLSTTRIYSSALKTHS